jgi:dihydrofolate reductase
MLRADDHNPKDEGGDLPMSKLVAPELVSLDGVVGSPEEWQLPYFHDEMGKEIEAAMAEADTMLLGRVTYEERAAFFPSRSSEDLPSANYMNQTLKYVVSTTLEESLEWNNSTLIKGEPRGSDRQAQAAAGKGHGCLWQPHLVRSLLREGPLDELRLMVHPVVVGGEKRLFEEGGAKKALELVDSKTFGTGVLYLTYQPAGQEADG